MMVYLTGGSAAGEGPSYVAATGRANDAHHSGAHIQSLCPINGKSALDNGKQWTGTGKDTRGTTILLPSMSGSALDVKFYIFKGQFF